VGVEEILQNGQAKENTQRRRLRGKTRHAFGRWDTENYEGKRIELDGVRATDRDGRDGRAVL